jgi:hypothetical protein
MQSIRCYEIQSIGWTLLQYIGKKSAKNRNSDGGGVGYTLGTVVMASRESSWKPSSYTHFGIESVSSKDQFALRSIPRQQFRISPSLGTLLMAKWDLRAPRGFLGRLGLGNGLSDTISRPALSPAEPAIRSARQSRAWQGPGLTRDAPWRRTFRPACSARLPPQ